MAAKNAATCLALLVSIIIQIECIQLDSPSSNYVFGQAIYDDIVLNPCNECIGRPYPISDSDSCSGSHPEPNQTTTEQPEPTTEPDPWGTPEPEPYETTPAPKPEPKPHPKPEPYPSHPPCGQKCKS